MAKNLTPTSPQELRSRRQKSEFTVQVSEGLVVRMKRVDMVSLVLNDILPLDMLTAAQEFKNAQDRLRETDPAASDEDAAIAAMREHEERRDNFKRFLKRFACAAVLEPKFVLEDDGDPNHVPVEELDFEELLVIWNAHPDLKSTGQVATPEAVTEFRGPAPTAPGDAVRDSESVQSETQLVDLPERQFIHA